MIRKKLSESRGASILLALMLFLVCATVAAVIVGSAATNVHKIRERQARQQVYEDVSSAALLVRDAMAQLSYEGVEYVRVYGCTGQGLRLSDPKEHSTEKDFYRFAETDGHTDVIAETVRRGAEKVYRSQMQQAVEKRLPFVGWSESFIVEETVAVTVSIDANYQLMFTFAPADPKWADSYQMTLLCQRASAEAPATQREALRCSHTETYETVENGQPVTRTRPVTFENGETTYYSTTVRWESGMIYKGVSRRA